MRSCDKFHFRSIALYPFLQNSSFTVEQTLWAQKFINHYCILLITHKIYQAPPFVKENTISTHVPVSSKTPPPILPTHALYPSTHPIQGFNGRRGTTIGRVPSTLCVCVCMCVFVCTCVYAWVWGCVYEGVCGIPHPHHHIKPRPFEFPKFNLYT